jgi:glycosyltransferase involved in cell wall biosynthesis
MKITFLKAGGFSFAGGDRVIAIYAERLQKRGHEVCVIARPNAQPSLRQKLQSLLKGKPWFSETEKEASHFDDIDVPHRSIDRCRPIVDADVPDADVVIATWWETAEWVASLSEAKGAKVYFIQHHEVFDYLPQERAKATYSLPLYKITIANWLLDLMQNQYGDPNVSLVPNSVDTKLFYAPPRSKQPIPTVGMLYASALWKGCDISLKAFSLAQKKIPNLHLVAFGSGNLWSELPLPPGSEYGCQLPQNALKDFYAKCDAWLFSSRVEGFGLPILEAMACRTPVIGAPAGAAPELLSDGAGILVKPEDPEDVARAIEQICSLSDAEWRVMSDAAYAKATSYTWDDATDLFEAALHKAIDRWKHGDILNYAG